MIKSLSYFFRFALVISLVGASATAAAAQERQITDSTFVQSGDAKLYIELRGPAEKTPILLYLHGGPGQPLGIVGFRAYVGPALESHFLVCYLHQRGVINSPMPPESSLTVANHVADVHNVIQYLHNRFPTRKLFLLGHSWGGTLALLSLLDYQGPVAGVIDACGPPGLAASRAASYQATLKWAEDTGNKEAIQALKAVGPPPYHDLDQQIQLSTWSSQANGGLTRHLDQKKLLCRPPLTTMDPSWDDRQLLIIKKMAEEIFGLNVAPRLGSLKTPLLMIAGKLDVIVPPGALRESFKQYGGPKQWVELPASNHLCFVDEPDAFVKAVVDFVR